MNNHQPRRLRAAHKSAFTLVELLVVIGIIALLIGILLPVLGKAREAANTAKCAANMRSATQALMLYTGAYGGWLPGPCTSGMNWPNAAPYNSATMSTTDQSADTAPLQNMDWVSPTFGTMFRWPENDFERLKTIFNLQLSCPSNKRDFDTFISVTGAPSVNSLQSQSYSAVLQFHAFPGMDSNKPYPPVTASAYPAAGLTAPSNYVPRISKVGPPAAKVYLVEGARYYDPAAGYAFSFNGYRYQKSGGNFMIIGPFTNAANTPYAMLSKTSLCPFKGDSDVQPLAYSGAWRHNKRMNMAFFDGHVEARTIRDSLSVGLYVPPGTTIADKSYIWDPTATKGQVIQ